ncbi:MAG TPA: helix-turn-helix domain-containing protein [Longimicrobium sp.]|jgi:AcrR family transcriptional regulator|uniref:TetR/AcrR family transcriptional regulator n=1 Tax=Longimicrobium sp. TaxID=2029185 RepID=UPI002ED7B5AF
MPRPRSASTEQIVAAAIRVIGRMGPSRLTLADVGAEAGLSAAALVQRFGGKRELLLAVARSGAGSVQDQFDEARARFPSSPLNALMDALAGEGGPMQTPEEVVNHLAFLQIDLTDPEFHALALQHARATLEEISALIEEATAAGELGDCDPDGVGRTVQNTLNGALVTWAIYREGTLAEWVRGEIEAVLEPYR